MRRVWKGIENTEKNIYKVTAYASGIAAEWITEDVKEAFNVYDKYCRDYHNYRGTCNYIITLHENGKLMKSTTI